MTDQTQPTGSPISDELADAILAVKERGVPCPPNCDYQTHRRAEMRAVLEAALPHLRPLVEAQELRLATEVALKLGRQEALAEGVAAIERSEDDARRAEERTHDRGWSDIATGYMRSAEILRGIGKGDSA